MFQKNTIKSFRKKLPTLLASKLASPRKRKNQYSALWLGWVLAVLPLHGYATLGATISIDSSELTDDLETSKLILLDSSLNAVSDVTAHLSGLFSTYRGAAYCGTVSPVGVGDCTAILGADVNITIVSGTRYYFHNLSVSPDLDVFSAEWGGDTVGWENEQLGTDNADPIITQGASTSVTLSEDNSPTAFSLTLNATDADENTVVRWGISTQANKGTASVFEHLALTANTSESASIAIGDGSSSTINYIAGANEHGSDSFVVTVRDENGGEDTITVNVTITPVNDAPIITEGTSTSVTLSEGNSPTAFALTLHASDADSDDITWSIGTQASKGTATASGTGTSKAIIYVPAANENGSDSFVVKISDGNGGEDLITVNLTIEETPTDSAYTALPDFNSYYGDTTSTGAYLVYKSSPTAEPVALAVYGGEPPHTTYLNAAEPPYASEVGYCGSSLPTSPDACLASLPLELQASQTHYFSYNNGSEIIYIKSLLSNKGFVSREFFTIADTTNSDPSKDTVPPVFSTLSPITIDATGLFTRLTATAPQAQDAKDGAVTATRQELQYKPGVHKILWTAKDIAGNTSTAEQVLHINPLVNFEIDQRAEEGGDIDVRVVLNGQAAVYPVEVAYTVSGTAADTDHDASDDTLTITSGIEGKITFELLADSLTGEAGETVIFTLADISNGAAGNKTSHTVTVIESNESPAASLSVSQASKPRLLINKSDGTVIVTANVNDPNPSDTHQYDWSGSANNLIDTDADNSTFSFDPSNLSAGIYTLQVKVSDSGSPTQSVIVDVAVNILATPIVLTAGEDSDKDGTNDTIEGAEDSDGDRIPDYLDAIGLSNILQTKNSTHDAYLMETNPGLSLRLGVTAFKAGVHIAGLDDTTLATESEGNTADQTRTHHSQIFDFEVKGLAENGASVDVVLPLNKALPLLANYRKYDAVSGWNDFVEDANNTLKSAQGADGYCPSVGDRSYSSGLTAGHHCILVTIEDGGPNDADKKANGEVIDPGVIAVTNPKRYKVSGGGNLGFPLLGLLLAAGLLRKSQSRKTQVRKKQAGKTLLTTSIMAATLMSASIGAQAESNNDAVADLTAEKSAEKNIKSAINLSKKSSFNSSFNSKVASKFSSIKPLLKSFYLTGNLGFADGDTNKSDLESDLASDGIDAKVSSLNTGRLGWGLGVGYNIGQDFALELAYQDLQQMDFELDTISPANKLAKTHANSGAGVQLSGLYHYAINDQWQLQARAGFLYWQADYQAKQIGGAKVSKDSDSGFDVLWGLGASYQINPEWAVSSEFQRYQLDSDNTNYYTVAVQWWPWK